MDPQDETREASLPGRTIGSYRIERRIGRGGMGEVFRAQDLRLKRTVAVKSLRGERADDELSRQRFVREARLASRVAHPYIATVFDVVDDGGVLLLVMEYIRGDTLHRRLKDGDVEPKEVVRWGLEIAEALQAIHEAGVVHRDLKPGNVMLAPNGHVKVTDFGVARITAPPVADDSVSPTWTESPGDFVTPGGGSGTVQYMSPEQVRGDAIDARSDLFSLGVILWEAITGEHPFRRETRFETASAILTEEPGNGEVPESLDANPVLRDVILRLLRKDPGERYADSSEVVATLQALAQPEQDEPVSRAERLRRNTWTIVGSIVAVIVIVVVAEYIRDQITPPGDPVPDVRPVIAVLPFDDPDPPDGAEYEAEMVAALLAADLADSRSVRALGNPRTEEILGGLGPGAEFDARVAALQAAAPLDWILAGEIFRVEGGIRASVELYRAGVATPSESFRVDASRASGLIDRIAARVQGALGGDGGDGAEAAGARIASDSDEANLLEYRARKAHREYRLGDAIRLYEQAQRIDPRLITAGIGEALARYIASEGAVATNTIRRVMERVEDAGDDVPPIVASKACAASARIHGDAGAELEQRAALVDSYPDDPELLEEYAEALRRAGKPDEARAAIDRAIALDDMDPRLHLFLAQLLVESGKTALGLAEVERSRELFAEIRSETGIAFTDLTLGHLRRFRAEYEEARLAYEAANERYVRQELPMLAAIARSNAADMLLRSGMLQEAESIYRETLAIARSVGYSTLVVQDLNALGGAYFGQGDLTRAESYLRQAVEEARHLGSASLLVSPVLNLANVLGYSNRTEESEPLAGEALELARSLGDRASESHARILLADAHFKQGRIETAVNDYREVVRIDEAQGGNPTNLIWGLNGVAEMQGALGELGEALAASTRAVELSAASEDPIVLGYPRLRHAWVQIELGRNDEALAELDRVDTVAASTSPPLADLQLRSGLLRGIARASASRPGALDVLESNLVEISTAGDPQLSARGLVAAARIAIAGGDPARGVRFARQAVALERLGRPVLTEARATLALALAMQGQWDEAESVARGALADAAGMAARFAVATAAAAVVEVASSRDVADVGAIGDRGRLALRAIEATIEPDRRDAFRARPDIQVLMQRLAIEAG